MLNFTYILLWVFSLIGWGAVAVNRNFNNVLGLYEVRAGCWGWVWDGLMLGTLLVVPVLSIWTVIRLRHWRGWWVLEFFVAVATWYFIWYNMGFIQG